ncbi:MAG: hypothetical protein IPM06_21920 [Rhizobiales bacterium]|nr:hypothetical protein [Hyphomicrobiales bacterium]
MTLADRGDERLIGLIYTAVSVVRSYAIRRRFNARPHAAAMKPAGDPMDTIEFLRRILPVQGSAPSPPG